MMHIKDPLLLIANPFNISEIFKISATITFIQNSKRTYLYFGINSLKRHISNPIAKKFYNLAITVILGGGAPSARMS